MNKSTIAIAAAVLAAATGFASSAEAGFKIHLGFGGPLSFFGHGNSGGYSQRHYTRRSYVATRSVAKKVHVATKKAEPTEEVAKVETPEVVAALPVAEPITTAEIENSSITTAAVDPSLVTSPETPATTAAVEPLEAATLPVKPAAEASGPKLEKSASKLDCKKFFPSVGMTLTVPCE